MFKKIPYFVARLYFAVANYSQGHRDVESQVDAKLTEGRNCENCNKGYKQNDAFHMNLLYAAFVSQYISLDGDFPLEEEGKGANAGINRGECSIID